MLVQFQPRNCMEGNLYRHFSILGATNQVLLISALLPGCARSAQPGNNAEINNSINSRSRLGIKNQDGGKFFPFDASLASVFKFVHEPGMRFLQTRIILGKVKARMLANEEDQASQAALFSE